MNQLPLAYSHLAPQALQRTAYHRQDKRRTKPQKQQSLSAPQYQRESYIKTFYLSSPHRTVNIPTDRSRAEHRHRLYHDVFEPVQLAWLLLRHSLPYTASLRNDMLVCLPYAIIVVVRLVTTYHVIHPSISPPPPASHPSLLYPIRHTPTHIQGIISIC